MLSAATLSVCVALTVVAGAATNLKLVSRTSGGTPADGHSGTAQPTAVTPDGKLVVFQSVADNLPGGNGVASQIYVRNLATGKTALASADPDGNPAADGSYQAGISANGRLVCFQGEGSGFPGANSEDQVWIRDRQLQKTFMASRANGGAAGDAPSYDCSISSDGSRVAFASQAENLPGGPTSSSQLYVRDLDRKKTILVSKTNGGDPASGSLYGQTISSDGNRVVFYSNDKGLPGGDGLAQHVYVRDLDRGRTILVDQNSNEVIGNDEGYNASISGNGRFAIFESQATNLPDPGASSNQIYIRDLREGKTTLAGRNSAGKPQNGYAEFAHLSGNGRYVEFNSSASNLPGGAAPYSLVYVRDRHEGTTRLVSRAADGGVPDDEATNGSMSVGGDWVVFESPADNLGGDPDYTNVFRVGPLG